MKLKFISIFLFITVFSVTYLTIDIINKNIFGPIQESTTLSETTDIQKYRYRISAFNGKIAVFDSDSKLPYKVYDTYIDTLPEEDRKIIEKGIFTDSSSELIKIIEDYTSWEIIDKPQKKYIIIMYIIFTRWTLW